MTEKCLSIKLLLTLCIVSIVLPVAACASDLNGESAAIKEENQMADGKDEENMRSEQNYPELTMPPIDQEMPENLQTATLALG